MCTGSSRSSRDFPPTIFGIPSIQTYYCTLPAENPSIKRYVFFLHTGMSMLGCWLMVCWFLTWDAGFLVPNIGNWFAGSQHGMLFNGLLVPKIRYWFAGPQHGMLVFLFPTLGIGLLVPSIGYWFAGAQHWMLICWFPTWDAG